MPSATARTACPAGVMSVDFNPEQPHLLAVGCYDGTVMVYDLRCKVCHIEEEIYIFLCSSATK